MSADVESARPRYVVLAGAAGGLPLAPLSAVLPHLPPSYRPMTRDLIMRRMPPGAVRHEDDLWCTRWVVRWAIRWVAGVLRGDAQVQALIDAVDAAPQPGGEETPQ